MIKYYKCDDFFGDKSYICITNNKAIVICSHHTNKDEYQIQILRSDNKEIDYKRMKEIERKEFIKFYDKISLLLVML